MKKKILIICFLFIVVNESYAQYSERKERCFTLWGSTGISHLNHSINDTKTSPFIGLSIGVGYQWIPKKKYSFLLGIEFNLLTSKTNVTSFMDNIQLIDTDNSVYNKFLFKASFTDYFETNNLFYLNLPVLFEWKFKKNYLSVGAKGGINILSKYRIKTNLTSTGEYEWFIEDFQNMPNHFFVNSKELKDRDNLNMKTNLLNMSTNLIFSAEFGQYIDVSRILSEPKKMKFVMFLDYGVNINSPKTLNDKLLSYKPNPTEYDFASIYSLKNSQNNYINSIYVGFKVYYLFCFKKKWVCKYKK